MLVYEALSSVTKLGTIAFMLHPAHIRVARALLGWHQVVLARKAKVGLACSEAAKLDRFWLEFSVLIPWLGGAENDEGLAIFGRPEGVHPEAGR